jgi:geranylgeranyl pyrophosphate synthase
MGEPGRAPAPPSAASAGDILAEARQHTDAQLASWAARLAPELGGRTGDALSYALLTPGKRVRAALVLAAYRAVGGSAPGIGGVAAAVETVHAYSLVHDDLPCMDDDDLRRGRPTTHRQFDVVTATRVGFLLVPVAARILSAAAEQLGLAPATLGRMAVELFRAGGIEGMVGGQWLDLEAEGRSLTLQQLMTVHRGKTGALIRASCTLGGIAGRAPEGQVSALTAFGDEIGLAFQIADDVLDCTGTSEELGKTAGRDAALAKSTYVQLLGIDGARREAETLARRAVAHLERGGVPSGALGTLAGYIVSRTS